MKHTIGSERLSRPMHYYNTAYTTCQPQLLHNQTVATTSISAYTIRYIYYYYYYYYTV